MAQSNQQSTQNQNQNPNQNFKPRPMNPSEIDDSGMRKPSYAANEENEGADAENDTRPGKNIHTGTTTKAEFGKSSGNQAQWQQNQGSERERVPADREGEAPADMAGVERNKDRDSDRLVRERSVI